MFRSLFLATKSEAKMLIDGEILGKILVVVGAILFLVGTLSLGEAHLIN